ncbi:MAG: signal peptidase II [Candidatus Coproplasma sp.]
MAENKKKLKLKVSFGKSGLILVAVFAVLLAADLVLKVCAEKYEWQFTVIPTLIEVVPMQHNTGAAFSFLNDKAWAQTFFIVLTFIMLAVMVAAFLLIPKRFVVLKVAIVLVAAGAVGNLVDRLAFAYVRDFVNVWIFGTVACCNFADFWIVLGVILGAIDLLFLNEWAAFPLTKKAKAAQAKGKQEEQAKGLDQTADASAPEDTVVSIEEAAAQEIKKDNETIESDGEEK